MGNYNSINKINFENMQEGQKGSEYLIINTLDINNQSCLIKGTISPLDEVRLLNENLKKANDIKIHNLWRKL